MISNSQDSSVHNELLAGFSSYISPLMVGLTVVSYMRGLSTHCHLWPACGTLNRL
jgi:hypothetical protein